MKQNIRKCHLCGEYKLKEEIKTFKTKLGNVLASCNNCYSFMKG